MDGDRLVRCRCDDEFPLRDLREHRLACVELAQELQRRRRLLQPPEWTREAKCLTKDPDDFFVDEASYVTTPIEQAKRVCARCPVREQCLEYAYSHEATEEQGIYAGTRGRDRQAMKSDPDRIRLLLDSERRYAVEHDLLMRGEMEGVA